MENAFAERQSPRDRQLRLVMYCGGMQGIRIVDLMEQVKSESSAESSVADSRRNLDLFRRQKALLDTFLSTGAISQAQHDKSLNCLIEKMDIKDGR